MNPTTSSPSMSPPPPGGSCSRTLLIPVEDNEACLAALRWTLAHVYRPGDTLLFLRIIPEPPAPTACAFSAPFGSASKLEAGRHLDAVRSAIAARFAPLADAAGARYTLATVTTADASCETIGGLICERATGVGLVVIAAHNKKGALARFCLGSVTQHCVAHSPATVLVMREDGFR